MTILKDNYQYDVNSLREIFLDYFCKCSSIEQLIEELNEVFKPFIKFYCEERKLPKNIFWLVEPFEIYDIRKIITTINLDKERAQELQFEDKNKLRKYLDSLFYFLEKRYDLKKDLIICLG